MTYLDQSNCPACRTPWDKSNFLPEEQLFHGVDGQKRYYFECPCGMQVTGYKYGVIKVIRKYLGTEYVAVWTDNDNGSSWLCKMKPDQVKIDVQIPFDLTHEQLKLYLTFS